MARVRRQRRGNPVPKGLTSDERKVWDCLWEATPAHAPLEPKPDCAGEHWDFLPWRVWAFVPWVRVYVGMGGRRSDLRFAGVLQSLESQGLIDVYTDPDQEKLLARTDLKLCPLAEGPGGTEDATLWIKLSDPAMGRLELNILEQLRERPDRTMPLDDLARSLGVSSADDAMNRALGKLGAAGRVTVASDVPSVPVRLVEK